MNTQPTPQVDEFVRDMTKVGSIPKSEVRRRLLGLITSAEQRGIDQTTKAFGGCTKCYGKGYSTVIELHQWAGDFIGDKPGEELADPIVPCTCERGKAIERIKTVREQRGAMRVIDSLPEGFAVGVDYQQLKVQLKSKFGKGEGV